MADVFYSISWIGKADGEVVTYNGVDHTIGVDAFASYKAAKAVSDTVVVCDKFYSAAWAEMTEGTVNVTLEGEEITLTLGVEAFPTSGKAKTAAGTNVGIVRYGDSTAMGSGTREAILKANDEIRVLSHHTDTSTEYNGGFIAGNYNGTIIVSESTLDKLDGYASDHKDNVLTEIIDNSTLTELWVQSMSTDDAYTYDETTGKVIWTEGVAHGVTNAVVRNGSKVTAAYFGKYAAGAVGEFTLTVENSYIGKIWGVGMNSGGTTNANETLILKGGTVGAFNGTKTENACKHYILIQAESGKNYINQLSLSSSHVSGVGLVINAANHASISIGNSFVANTPANRTISVNVEGFQFEEGVKAYTLATSTDLSKAALSVTGTALCDYEIIHTTTSISIETLTAYYSAGWADLADGTEVTTPNGKATIGKNAFATYDEAYAYNPDKLYFVDTYAVAKSAVGDKVTIDIPSGTFEATIDDKTFCTSISKAQTNFKTGGSVIVYGGTQTGSRTSLTNCSGKKTFFYNFEMIATGTEGGGGGVGNAPAIVVDNDGDANVRGEVIIGKGTTAQSVYSVRADRADIKTTMTVQDGATVSWLNTNSNGTVTSTATYTIDETTGKLLWNDVEGAHSEVTFNLQGGSVGSLSSVSYSGNYTGDLVINTSGNAYVAALSGHGTAAGNRTHGNFFVNMAGGTINKIDATTNLGNRYMEIVVGGTNTTSTIGSFANMASLKGYSITVNAKDHAALALNSAAAVNVTIDNTDFAFAEGEKVFTVIAGNTSKLNYTLVQENYDGYVVEKSADGLIFAANPIEISKAFSTAKDGDVVTTWFGSGTVGVNAFTSREAMEKAGVEGYAKYTDVFFNKSWTTGATVTVDGNDYVVGDGKAFNDWGAACTACKANGNGVVHVTGGNWTSGRTYLSDAPNYIENINYLFASGGGLVGGVDKGITSPDVIFAGGYVQSYWASRGGTVTDAKATVLAGGTVGSIYAGYSGSTVQSAVYRVDGGIAGNVAFGDGGVTLVEDGVFTVIVENNATVGDINLGNNNSAGAAMIHGSYSVSIDDSTVSRIMVGAGGAIETAGGYTYRIDNSYVNRIGHSGLNTADMAHVTAAYIDLAITGSTVNVFNMTRLSTTGELKETLDDVVLPGGFSFTSADTADGSFGSATLSAKNLDLGNAGFTFFGGNSQYTTTVVGDAALLIDNVKSQGFSIVSTKAEFGSNLTLDIVDSLFGSDSSAYLLNANTHIAGDYTVNVSDSRFLRGFEMLSKATVDGNVSLNFVGGTSEISQLNDCSNIVTISEGATLVFGDNYGNAQTLVDLVNNGNYVFNGAVKQGEILQVVSNMTGSGTITTTTNKLFEKEDVIYAASKQNVLYVNADWAELSDLDTVEWAGADRIFGVNAFATKEAALEMAAENATIYEAVVTDEEIKGDGKLAFAGATVTKNAYAGGELIVKGIDEQVSVFSSLVGGSKIAGSATIADDSSVTIKGNNISGKALVGSSYITGNAAVTMENSTSTVSVSSGSFSNSLIGGALVNGALASVEGTLNTNVTLAGGTVKALGGGCYLQGEAIADIFKNGSAKVAGTANVTIEGGVVVGHVFGGSFANLQGCATQYSLEWNGDINVTIDTTKSSVEIGGNLVAGNYGKGSVSGNTTLTFKGSNALTINGHITGDCSGGSDTPEGRFVAGTRTLAFDGFNGSLGTEGMKLAGFDAVTLKGGEVEIASYGMLASVGEWSITDGTLDWSKGANDFGQDKLSLISTADIDEEGWTVFRLTDSLITGWDGFTLDDSGDAKINLSINGNAGVAVWDDGKDAYVATLGDANYKFYKEDNALKVAKLA